MAKKATRKKVSNRTRAKTNIRVKRTYDPPAGDDGLRILIDRLWPARHLEDRTQARCVGEASFAEQ